MAKRFLLVIFFILVIFNSFGVARSQKPPEKGAKVASNPLYVLLVDKSGSMDKRWAEMLETSRAFITNIPIGAQIVFYFFSDPNDIYREGPFTINNKKDTQQAIEKINQYQPSGKTALWKTICSACSLIKEKIRENPDRFIVLGVFTDGEDTASPGDKKKASECLKSLHKIKNKFIWYVKLAKNGASIPYATEKPPGKPIYISFKTVRCFPYPKNRKKINLRLDLAKSLAGGTEILKIFKKIKIKYECNGKVVSTQEPKVTKIEKGNDSRWYLNLELEVNSRKEWDTSKITEDFVKINHNKIKGVSLQVPPNICLRFMPDPFEIVAPKPENPKVGFCSPVGKTIFFKSRVRNDIKDYKVIWYFPNNRTVEGDSAIYRFGAKGEKTVTCQLIYQDGGKRKASTKKVKVNILNVNLKIKKNDEWGLGPYLVGDQPRVEVANKSSEIHELNWFCNGVYLGQSEKGKKSFTLPSLGKKGNYKVWCVGNMPQYQTEIESEKLEFNVYAAPQIKGVTVQIPISTGDGGDWKDVVVVPWGKEQVRLVAKIKAAEVWGSLKKDIRLKWNYNWDGNPTPQTETSSLHFRNKAFFSGILVSVPYTWEKSFLKGTCSLSLPDRLLKRRKSPWSISNISSDFKFQCSKPPFGNLGIDVKGEELRTGIFRIYKEITFSVVSKNPVSKLEKFHIQGVKWFVDGKEKPELKGTSVNYSFETRGMHDVSVELLGPGKKDSLARTKLPGEKVNIGFIEPRIKNIQIFLGEKPVRTLSRVEVGKSVKLSYKNITGDYEEASWIVNGKESKEQELVLNIRKPKEYKIQFKCFSPKDKNGKRKQYNWAINFISYLPPNFLKFYLTLLASIIFFGVFFWGKAGNGPKQWKLWGGEKKPSAFLATIGSFWNIWKKEARIPFSQIDVKFFEGDEDLGEPYLLVKRGAPDDDGKRRGFISVPAAQERGIYLDKAGTEGEHQVWVLKDRRGKEEKRYFFKLEEFERLNPSTFLLSVFLFLSLFALNWYVYNACKGF